MKANRFRITDSISMAPFPFLLMLFVGQAMEFRSALFGVSFGVSEYNQARHIGNMYLFLLLYDNLAFSLPMEYGTSSKAKVFSILQKHEIGIKAGVMEWNI